MNEIKLKDLISLFVRRLWVMILVAIISMSIVAIQQNFILTPKYESTATLYILKKENQVSDAYTNSDFSLALDVVNDCTYILKSHAVLDEVIDELDLDVSYSELYNSISTNNPSDTRILEVVVESTDAKLSKKIVNKICSIGTRKITDAMGFQQVNMYENGQIETHPSNKLNIVQYLIIGFIAALLTYTIFLVLFLVDDTLETKEEIEKALGISVIGEIPNYNGERRQGYGYRRYGYGYRAKPYGQDNKRKGKK